MVARNVLDQLVGGMAIDSKRLQGPTKRSMDMSESTVFTRDPSCGMRVGEATSPHSVRDGKTYYFCSEICLKRFASLSAGQAKTCAG